MVPHPSILDGWGFPLKWIPRKWLVSKWMISRATPWFPLRKPPNRYPIAVVIVGGPTVDIRHTDFFFNFLALYIERSEPRDCQLQGAPPDVTSTDHPTLRLDLLIVQEEKMGQYMIIYILIICRIDHLLSLHLIMSKNPRKKLTPHKDSPSRQNCQISNQAQVTIRSHQLLQLSQRDKFEDSGKQFSDLVWPPTMDCFFLGQFTGTKP